MINTKAFLMKVFKNFEEQIEFFVNVIEDILTKKTRPSSLNLLHPLSSSKVLNIDINS